MIGCITKKSQNFSELVNCSQNQIFRNFTKKFLMFKPFDECLNALNIKNFLVKFLNIWFWEQFTNLDKFCDFFVMHPITLNDISF